MTDTKERDDGSLGADDRSAASTQSYLTSVASAEPTPGGGSVAAVVAALAAALGEMVCRLSTKPSEGENTNDEIDSLQSRFAAHRRTLLACAVDDEKAYAAFRHAVAMPKTDPSEKVLRTASMQSALLAAALVPLATATVGRDLLPDIAFVAAEGNPHVRSDAVIAAILADAAVRACAINVRVNTAMLRDKARASQMEEDVAAIATEASDLMARIV